MTLILNKVKRGYQCIHPNWFRYILKTEVSKEKDSSSPFGFLVILKVSRTSLQFFLGITFHWKATFLSKVRVFQALTDYSLPPLKYQLIHFKISFEYLQDALLTLMTLFKPTLRFQTPYGILLNRTNLKNMFAQYVANLPRKNRMLPRTYHFTHVPHFRTQGKPRYWNVYKQKFRKNWILHTVLFIEQLCISTKNFEIILSSP